MTVLQLFNEVWTYVPNGQDCFINTLELVIFGPTRMVGTHGLLITMTLEQPGIDQDL